MLWQPAYLHLKIARRNRMQCANFSRPDAHLRPQKGMPWEWGVMSDHIKHKTQVGM